MTDDERNADVSKTLTEQWKAGELGHGAFYVRLFTGAVVVDVFDANPLRFTLYENDIDEVIAPVPSYGEYKAMQAAAPLKWSNIYSGVSLLTE